MKEHSLADIYALVLNHLDIGLHVVDSSGKTLIYNSKMAELEEIPQEEMLGKEILELIKLQPETSTLLTTLKNGISLENRKQSYLTQKGIQVTTVNSTRPLYNQGRLIGAMELAKDITYIKQLAEKVSVLQEELHQKGGNNLATPQIPKFNFNAIMGTSEILLQSIRFARQAARTDSTILIYGESGTGKELFAQSIHNASPRAAKAFIAQNCAALPEDLLEGLLFGTARGGFTGAIDRPGLFELASGGTLFLDELNSLPVRLQAKLLRVLQEKTIRRVGGLRDVEVDVRIITSLNIDPEQALLDHTLREDMFYRLSVVTLAIPPLRDRKEDIPLLTASFIDRFSRKFSIPKPECLQVTLELLQAYNWPGNVRELEHVIEGGLNIIQPGEALAPAHLPHYLLRRLGISEQGGFELRSYTGDVEKEKILSALRECQGNISQTARKLGISRQSLQYKLKKYT